MTRRRHSQIRKEDHGPSIFTCPAHTLDVRQDGVLNAAKMRKCEIDEQRLQNRGSNIQCLFPSVGSCTTSQSVSAVFGTVPYSLPLVPDSLYGIRFAVFSGSSSGESLLTLIFLFYC